jgi:hypothetical protein
LFDVTEELHNGFDNMLAGTPGLRSQIFPGNGLLIEGGGVLRTSGKRVSQNMCQQWSKSRDDRTVARIVGWAACVLDNG